MPFICRLYLTGWMIPTALFIIAFASEPDTHVTGDIIAEVLFGCAFVRRPSCLYKD